LAAEEEDSKKTLQNFLESTRIEKLIPSRKIILVSKDTTVEETLKLMAANQLISLPVQDKQVNKFIGMFDVLDLVALALSFLEKKNDPLTEFHKMPVGKVINFSTCDVFSPMSAELSLWHLVETFTRGIHRIPVTNKEGGEIINIVSQSTVIKFLSEHSSDLGAAAKKTATDLGLGKKSVVSIPDDAKALDGYKLINQHKVEAVAVVSSKDGKLLGALSASDMRGISGDLLKVLDAPMQSFIRNQRKPETCKTNITMKQAIDQLAGGQTHRIFIVDSSDRPIGIISQSDIMKALMLSLNVTPRRKKTRSVDFSKLRLSGNLSRSSTSGFSP